jgi:outer membrane protein
MPRSIHVLVAAGAAIGFASLAGSARADDQGGAPAGAFWAAITHPTEFQAGDIMVRLRGLAVVPENNSSSVSTIHGSVSANTTAVPEIDVSYFLTSNIAFEVIAATTQHRVTANDTALGHVDVGTAYLLPPTVTAQYHFWTDSRFSPYVGAGLNYTFFYDAKAPGSPVSRAQYQDNFGAALQIGVDYRISGNWYANADVKQIFLSTKAKLNRGALTAKVDLDPILIGVGVGYRF